MKHLPKRAFNSPLIRYANYGVVGHINLIRLTKPYANGAAYAIHDTTTAIGSGLYRDLETAEKAFSNLMSFAEITNGQPTEHSKTSNY